MINKFIPCRKCLNKSKISGYINTTLNNGQLAIIECDCHKEWREKKELTGSAKYANIWHDEVALAYSPDINYIGDLSRNNKNKLVFYVNNFDNEKVKSTSLYLYGPNSTQKTHLAHWVGLQLLRKNYTVKYLTMQQFVKLISDFAEREEKDEEVEILKNIDMLILDESFSKQKVTLYKSGFQLPFIEDFLKERIEFNHKATIFISNISVDEISSHGFSESIQQMIKRNTTEVGTDLEFKDNYYANINKTNIDSIFKDVT